MLLVESKKTKITPFRKVGTGGKEELMEDSKLKKYSTFELVEELRGREGVETTIAAPYEQTNVTVNGAAVVLIITD